MKRREGACRLKSLLATLCLAVAVGVNPGNAVGAEPKANALPELVLVAAGTQVGKSLPPGWDHLILKSVSRIETGDVDTLPSFAVATATLFRTVIVADVRPPAAPGGAYSLARLGLGVCVPVSGVDTVVTPDTAASPPVSLGMVERQVLAAADEQLKKTRLVGRTETFAVMAAPTDMKVGETHRKTLLYYAMLLDPASGRLTTLLWSTAEVPRKRVAPQEVTLLPPGLVYHCGLDVAADRLLGAIPVNWSFALCALPPGRQLATPARLKPWMIDPHKIAADPSGFEHDLREAFTTN